MLQAFWDDQKNLFLEFKIYKDEKFEIEPEDIKSIYIKFEIIPKDKKEIYQREPPYLISVNKFCLLDDSLFFPINFEDLNHYDDLKIKFLLLTVIFYSGKRILYSLKEIFEMADILLIEDNFENYFQEIKRSKVKIESTIVQEKVIETIDKDLETKKEKRTYIYEKNKIKKTIETDTIISMMHKGNKRLENVEEELKNIKTMIKSLSFNSLPSVSFEATNGPPKRIGIERIKRSTGPKSNNLFPSPSALKYMPELKALMKDNEKFRIYLKPMNNEELGKIILNDEQLIEKQEEIYHRQIEIIQKKEEKTISLDNLKKPK